MTDLIGLLDTNVFVDFSRGYKPAIEWLQSNSQLVFGVPSLVRKEMMLGTNNKNEQEKVVKLLKPYTIVHLSEIEF